MNLFTQPTESRPEPPRAASVAPSRSTDPQISRDAARAHEASGNASCNRERLLNEICRGPGRTAGELSRWLPGMDHVEICRRASDLERDGLIYPGEKRKCNERGTQMRPWFATPAGLKAGPKRG